MSNMGQERRRRRADDDSEVGAAVYIVKLVLRLTYSHVLPGQVQEDKKKKVNPEVCLLGSLCMYAIDPFLGMLFLILSSANVITLLQEICKQSSVVSACGQQGRQESDSCCSLSVCVFLCRRNVWSGKNMFSLHAGLPFLPHETKRQRSEGKNLTWPCAVALKSKKPVNACHSCTP